MAGNIFSRGFFGDLGTGLAGGFEKGLSTGSQFALSLAQLQAAQAQNRLTNQLAISDRNQKNQAAANDLRLKARAETDPANKRLLLQQANQIEQNPLSLDPEETDSINAGFPVRPNIFKRAGARIKNIFTRGNAPLPPPSIPDPNEVQFPELPESLIPDDGLTDDDRAQIEAAEQAKQAESDAVEAEIQLLPPLLQQKARHLAGLQGLKLEEKIAKIQALPKIQEQLRPTDANLDFLTTKRKLVGDISKAQNIVQRNPEALGIGEPLSSLAKGLFGGKLSKNERDRKSLDFYRNEIDPAAKLGKKDWTKQVFGVGVPTSNVGKESADTFIKELDILKKDAIGEYNTKRRTLIKQGFDVSGFEQLDVSTPKKANAVVKSMVEQGMDPNMATQIVKKEAIKQVQAKKQGISLQQPEVKKVNIGKPGGPEILIPESMLNKKPKLKLQGPVEMPESQMSSGQKQLMKEIQSGSVKERPEIKPPSKKVSNISSFINQLKPTEENARKLALTIARGSMGMDVVSREVLDNLDPRAYSMVDRALEMIEMGEVA